MTTDGRTSGRAAERRRGTGDNAAPATVEALVAFVPRLALELADPAGMPSWTSVDGSMLSADISGFTALSERLAGKGKAGAEEITELVNKCFTALINAAYSYGGEVLKFGGDALLVLFRGEDCERRAVDGGLAMQRALRSSAAARRAHLSMTVGVADGPFDIYIVGSTYRELLVTGARSSEVIRLEGSADTGDTLVAPDLAALLPVAMRVREEAGGVVVTGSTGRAPSGPIHRVESTDGIDAFVPAAVREQLEAFAELGGEHRLVTVGFLMIGGVDALTRTAGHRGVADAFHHLVDEIVAASARFGVTVLHTDIAPDGVKFVLCAGAPRTEGNTSEAMLNAGLQIATIDSPLTLRQGVQTGRVFAGFLGSEIRYTYTLMGDPVNTAARMLGKANDREIVAVSRVVHDTRTLFVTEELEPFLVKGKSEPIVAHKIWSISDEARSAAESRSLIGRAQELDLVRTAMDGAGTVIIISGPAGVGKTRLLESAVEYGSGAHLFRASCTPYGSDAPYSVFRPLLRAGSGIDVRADPAAAGSALRAIVEDAAPDLLPMLPLLAVPFGADVASTAEADAIDLKFRRARIHDLVVDFLDRTLDGATLLVVEDVHWLDDASGDLVTHLIRSAASRQWTGLLTRRDQGQWQPPELPNVERLALDALTDGDIRRLAVDAAGRPLSDHDLDTVVARAAGNPLFGIELARALTGSATALPDSIEGLIASRIDELPPTQRRLLRIASVIGREFDIDQVTSVASAGITVGEELGDMIEARGGRRYRFSHAMYRDVAYEGLPFRQRQRLHSAVGRHLEADHDKPDEIAGLLSLHYGAAGSSHPNDRAKAWHYSRVAGDTASAQYAHRDAATAYDRALRAASGLREIPVADRSRVAERLGDALLVAGSFQPAYAAFGRARTGADPMRKVDLMRRQGIVRDRQGALVGAARWYRRCLGLLPESGGSDEERHGRLLVQLAVAAVLHRQGRFAECLAWAEVAETEARDLDNKECLALALDRLHVASAYVGRDDADRYGVEALALHRELGDHLSQARILDNMGIEAYFRYDWDRAVEFYAQASAAGRIAGDVIEASLGRMNAAEVSSDRGQFALAEREFEDILRNWSAAGFSVGISVTRSNLALVRARRGDDDERSTLGELAQATESLRLLGADEFVNEALVRTCETAVHLGDLARARSAFDEAMAAVGSGERLTTRLARARGMALLIEGDIDGARAALRASLTSATADKRLTYEIGLTELALSAIGEDPATSVRLRREAIDVLSSLGVTGLPASFRRIGITDLSLPAP